MSRRDSTPALAPDGVHVEPPRLIESGGELGELLERANREFAPSETAVNAFYRAQAGRSERTPSFAAAALRADRSTPARPLGAALAFAAALLVLGAFVWLWPQGGAELATPAPSSVAQTAKSPPPLVERQETRRDAPAPALATPSPLVVGSNVLYDGSVVSLTSGSARVSVLEHSTRVELEHGRVELRASHQLRGRKLEVASGGHRFEVLGTVFSVSSEDGALELRVEEGRVAVYRGETLLRQVEAGGTWAGKQAGASPATSAPSSVAGSAPSASSGSGREPPSAALSPDCLAMARSGNAREAEACFEARATGSGLGAEMALYELARLRRDVLSNPTGALAALEQYRGRFPSGLLRREVDVSYVELLARTGQHQAALSQSRALLDSPAGRERAFDLHVLRGNVYRKGLSDLSRAEREYAAAERVGGTAGGEASYLRGLCLEGLGDRSGAAAAYRRALASAQGKRADELRRRLRGLEP